MERPGMKIRHDINTATTNAYINKEHGLLFLRYFKVRQM